MKTLGHVIAFSILLPLFLNFLFFQPFDIMGKEEKVLGQWIKSHLGSGAKIMDGRKLVAFYADGIPLGLPYAPLGEVLEYGTRLGADYLVVSERDRRPALQTLVEGMKVLPELDLVHILNRSDEAQLRNKIVLYRLRHTPLSRGKKN
jgi:hypothetical protein